jgi:hypothetical protein
MFIYLGTLSPNPGIYRFQARMAVMTGCSRCPRVIPAIGSPLLVACS